MGSTKLCAMALAIAAIYPAANAADENPPLPIQTPAAATTTSDSGAGNAQLAGEPRRLDAVEITAKRLDAARNELSPETGSTVYRFSQKDIDALPLGSATPLNQVVLQAPGAVQDSYGQLHVRGDHANLQYRINGVVIPEAISGFGQSLDTRFASQINILTGALPAQYGYRTAGVVDIQTQSSPLGNAASVSLAGGTHGHEEGSISFSGTNGDWSHFLTGSYLRDDLGIENPTAGRNAIHDKTEQSKGFGYLSRVLDDTSRISLMFGSSNSRFQIPNVPDQAPTYTLDNAPPVDSATLNANQLERNSFQVLSYQASPNDRLNYQVAVLHRYTDVTYRPDPVGDLVFNGIAAQILRKNDAYGVQSDVGYKLGEEHTVRAGVSEQREHFTTNNDASVFPADADGNQTNGTPIEIQDDTRINGRLFGVYLQDEWRATSALVVNYGARFDHVNTVVNEQQFSPRIGLVYDIDARTRLHAGYARYFTPPPTEKIDTTSVAKFQNTTNALPSDANTAVSSERSHYFDAGFSHQLTPEITLGFDAYYRIVKNLQDEGQFGNALIFSAFNYEKARVGGVELSASYRHADLTAYVNAAFSRAVARNIVTGQFNFDPDELTYIANNWVHLDHDQTIAASAGMSYQLGATQLGADLLFGSGLRRGFANTEHLPGYTQVNGSAQQTFPMGMLGKIDGRISVINLFDRSYQIRDGTGIGVGAPQYGPRRGAYVAFSKNF